MEFWNCFSSFVGMESCHSHCCDWWSCILDQEKERQVGINMGRQSGVATPSC